MGIVCCSRTNNMEIEINRRIINPKFSSKRKITSLPQLVILLQSYYRRHSAIIKLKREIEQIKDQISSQLDKKKLINDDIITECESEKLYQKLILTGKIKSYMEIVNSNKTIKKDLRRLEKLSFFIPNYIVASPTEVYKGSWNLNKKYHGYGIKYEFNTQNNIDSRTEGTFNNGLLFGFGRIILSNGEQFIGRFANGKMMGNGEYIRKDGSIYKGQFFEGLPHGKGNEIMSDGSLFDGDYFWGKPKRGKIIWKDGSNYDGEFENGKINGIGTYDWGNNKKYIGNWKEGKMDGRGKFIYSDGTYYVGEFVDGKKNGQGKYVWEENKYYIGQWKDDKPNGKGVYYKYGKETKGFWADGHIFSKTAGNNKNIFKEVRKRPTLGAYCLKYQNKFKLNDSSDKISTCRTHLKTGKSSKNIKSFNNKYGLDINSDNLINSNEDNQDNESTKSLKINKTSDHKYIQSNQI